MNTKISLWQLFCACLKIGLILLGGGYVILPIMQSELVEKRGWITDEELIEFYALAQSLPGIIAINTTIFIGYKLRGKFGALISIVGLVFSAFWIITILATILTKLVANSFVQSALWGVEVAVIVLIISSIREMWGKSMTSIFSYFIYVFAIGLLMFLKLSPVITIVLTIFVGILVKLFLIKRGNNNVE